MKVTEAETDIGLIRVDGNIPRNQGYILKSISVT
jgi:hypothetical protein